MSSVFKPIDLIANNEKDQVYCRPHNLEICTTCDQDFTALNALCRSIKQHNGKILPPNVINQSLTTQIAKLKDDGNKKFHSQNYAEAINIYSVAIELAYNRAIWERHALAKEELSICLSNRAAAYIALEAWIDAYVDAVAVIQMRRDWSKGHFRKGRALLGMKRYEEAVETFKLGLEYDPNSDEMKNGLAEAQEKVNKSKRD